MSTSHSSDNLRAVTAHLVRRAHQRHIRLWKEQVGYTLTPQQYAVLHEVALEPDINLTDLGERTALDRTTVGRVVERLVKAGHVNCEQSTLDRRQRLVTLTQQGADVLSETTPIATKVNLALVEHLGDEQHGQLVDLLATLVQDE